MPSDRPPESFTVLPDGEFLLKLVMRQTSCSGVTRCSIP